MRDRRFPILDGAFDPACVDCGACCTNPSTTEQPATNVCIFSDKELERFSPAVLATVVREPDGRMGFQMVRDGDFDRCPHLVGAVGVDAGCSLHETKPTECRWFLPGNSTCRDMRRHHSLPLSEDPVLRVDAREGQFGPEHLLDMRVFLGEIPNSIDYPFTHTDHYSRAHAAKETS